MSYGRKLKADQINSNDFYGSVANRSLLSISTLPDIPELSELAKKDINIENFFERKYSVPIPQSKRAVSMPLPRAVEQRPSPHIELYVPKNKGKNGTESIKNKIRPLSKIEVKKDVKKFFAGVRKLSDNLKRDHRGNSKDNEEYPDKDELRNFLKWNNDESVPFFKNTFSNVNPTGKEIFSSNNETNGGHFESPYPSLNESPSSIETKNTSVPSNGSLTSVETINDKILNLNRKSVYIENNQLQVEFSSSSSSSASLVSELLNAYSDLNYNKNYIKILDSKPCSSFTIPNAVTDSQRSTYSSTVDATTKSVSLFSDVPENNDSESNFSDDISSIDSSRIPPVSKNKRPLSTTSYNRKLPPTPIKKIDQFKLRDYKLSNIPQTPTISVKTNSSSSVYFTCEEASPIQDTNTNTQKKSNKYGELTNFNKKNQRIHSVEYLQRNNINQFMLRGFQDLSMTDN